SPSRCREGAECSQGPQLGRPCTPRMASQAWGWLVTDDGPTFTSVSVAWDIVREDRRQPSGLGEALLRTPPAPCNDCEYRQRCAEELLACWDFRKFVSRNPKIEEERVPKRCHYEAVFSGVDDEDLDEPKPGSKKRIAAGLAPKEAA